MLIALPFKSVKRERRREREKEKKEREREEEEEEVEHLLRGRGGHRLIGYNITGG